MEGQEEKKSGEPAKGMLWIAEIVCNGKKLHRAFNDVAVCGAWMANFQWFGEVFGIEVQLKIISKEVEQK